MAHDRKFRFGVQATERGVRGRVARQGAQDRGPRLLDALHARSLHRHRARADGRDRGRGRGHDDAAGRHARARQRLQAPGGRRQGGGDARRALRRPGRARHRRRVDADRLRRARAAVRLRRRAHRASRGGARGHQGLRGARAVLVRGRALHDHGLRRDPRSRCSSRRRCSSAGAAAKLLRLAGREADIVGINPNLRAGAITADAVQSVDRVGDEAEDRLGARGRGRPLRRHRAADPLLRVRRSPTTPVASPSRWRRAWA